jgi:hypothetical protein
VKMKIMETVKRVYLAPQMLEIPFEQVKGEVKVQIPKVQCHQMVVCDVEKFD